MLCGGLRREAGTWEIDLRVAGRMAYGYSRRRKKKEKEEDKKEFTPGPYPDLMEDPVGLDDRVLCFHG